MDMQFLEQKGAYLFFQLIVTLMMMVILIRNRRQLTQSSTMPFLSRNPYSSALFLGVMVSELMHCGEGAPGSWILLDSIVGGVAFARICSTMAGKSWKTYFIYSLTFVLMYSDLVNLINVPMPVLRLCDLIIAGTGIYLCIRFAKESQRTKEPRFYSIFLQGLSLLFVFVVLAQVAGKSSLARDIFTSLMVSIYYMLIFLMFMKIVRGGLVWLLHEAPLQKLHLINNDPETLIKRFMFLIDGAVCALGLIPAICVVWGVYPSLSEATVGLFTFGVKLGSWHITTGLVLTAVAICYGAFFISWVFGRVLIDQILTKRKVEKGIRLSIIKLIHYAVILVGFMIAVSVLGINITKITIMISALGIGIGFGLQGMVNNFVSGLILLFECPVRVGDSVQIEGKWAEIKSIGLRATRVQTVDQADVIIPNADLISNQVTNWTLTNRHVRLVQSVGVAYGSDVPLVIDTLLECAKSNPRLIKWMAPQVLFTEFGESTLNFELRVWVQDADDRMLASSELNQEIDRRFRENSIEISFPQRDLHLRTLPDNFTLSSKTEPDMT